MSEKRKVTVDGEEFEVILEKKGENWDVEIEGFNFSIKIDQGNSTNSSKKRKRGGSKRKLSGKISSSIPGKIVSLNVKLGDIVKQGQVVMILEAMKMQNEISSPFDGVVKKISVRQNDSVMKDDLLMEIEKT